jgi:hypothetical protein
LWIHVAASRTAFHADHISRIFVEETGTGAALKAEIEGKVTMIAYFPSKIDAHAALSTLLEQYEANVRVIRF